MAKKTDIWMPLYIGDYIADTGRLSTEQHGAYLLILMDYWRNGPPPDDNQVLSQITRLSPIAWSIARAKLEQFFAVSSGVWRQKRLDEELILAKKNKEVAQKKAKTAAEARWGSSNATSISTSNATDMLEQCPSPSPLPSSKPKPKKSTDKVKSTVPPSGETAEVFAYWQIAMGHPQARLDAKRERAIKARLKDGYTVAQLCIAIDGCKLSPHHMGQNDSRTVYDDVELICRDGPKVDKFIALVERGHGNGMSAGLQQQVSILDEWLREQGQGAVNV